MGPVNRIQMWIEAMRIGSNGYLFVNPHISKFDICN